MNNLMQQDVREFKGGTAGSQGDLTALR